MTRQDLSDGDRIRDYLFTIYGVNDSDLSESAAYWETLRAGAKPTQEQGRLLTRLPDMTEILSCIDIFAQEDLSVGTYQTECRSRFNPRRIIDARELRALRRAFSRALAHSFHKLDVAFKARKCTIVDQLAGRLGSRDSVITSNWDILMDRALHQMHGTACEDYGTRVRWLKPDQVQARSEKKRAPLLKLHGSMNWLQCRRCQTLYADPCSNAAIGDFDESAPFGNCRECKFRLSTLMVTPTFLKEYQSSHLGTVWNSALRALCRSSEWVFIGYSLPLDDIHIKTMLIRAFRVWGDQGWAPQILVVGRRGRDNGLRARYTQLFPGHVTMFDGDFADYLKTVVRPAARAMSNGLHEDADFNQGNGSPDSRRDSFVEKERRHHILRTGSNSAGRDLVQ